MNAFTSRCKHLISLFVPRVALLCNDGAAAGGEPQTQLVICNFAPTDDGWFPVALVGDAPHRLGLQRMTQDDADAIVANLAAKDSRWTGVPVYAGPAHPTGGDGPALAWAKSWRVADGALQCQPDWSPNGRDRILMNKERPPARARTAQYRAPPRRPAWTLLHDLRGRATFSQSRV